MSAASPQIRSSSVEEHTVLVCFNETLSHMLEAAFNLQNTGTPITCLRSQRDVGGFSWVHQPRKAATSRRSVILDFASAPDASCVFVQRHRASIEASQSDVICLTNRETTCPDIGPYRRLITAEMPVPDTQGQANLLAKLLQETWWID